MKSDAVIVVPGIMGSELRDGDGRVVWGLTVGALGPAWSAGALPRALRVRDEDLAGVRRLTPTRLLRVPAYAPFLRGLEPYGPLLRRLHQETGDERAVAEFPYDWRLPVTMAADDLVKRGLAHLRAWRGVVRQSGTADPADVRLVVVAHSMGGLVTRGALNDPEFAAHVRHVVTLGTPYFGSVDTVQLLATGEGAPVPRRAARALAVGCPGVYDLLPRYVCVDAADGQRSLSSADIAAVGASREMADQALARWQSLALSGPGFPVPVTAVVGALQPTLSSLRLRDGALTFSEKTLDDDPDAGGDSRVSRRAAAPLGVAAMPLPQRHGALAKTSDALGVVVDKLLGRDSGPRLSTRPLSARIPDLADAGKPQPISVGEVSPAGESIPTNLAGITVQSTNLHTQQRVSWRVGRRNEDGTLAYAADALSPGLHRVEVDGGGYSPISDIMLVIEPRHT